MGKKRNNDMINIIKKPIYKLCISMGKCVEHFLQKTSLETF